MKYIFALLLLLLFTTSYSMNIKLAMDSETEDDESRLQEDDDRLQLDEDWLQEDGEGRLQEDGEGRLQEDEDRLQLDEDWLQINDEDDRIQLEAGNYEQNMIFVILQRPIIWEI